MQRIENIATHVYTLINVHCTNLEQGTVLPTNGVHCTGRQQVGSTEATSAAQNRYARLQVYILTPATRVGGSSP